MRKQAPRYVYVGDAYPMENLEVTLYRVCLTIAPVAVLLVMDDMCGSTSRGKRLKRSVVGVADGID